MHLIPKDSVSEGVASLACPSQPAVFWWICSTSQRQPRATRTSYPSLRTPRHWAINGQRRFHGKQHGNRETAFPGSGGAWAGARLPEVQGKQAVRTWDQARVWGRQISPSRRASRLSERNDRSNRTSLEQTLLSSESPGTEDGKFSPPLSLMFKWEHGLLGEDSTAWGP